MISNMNSDIIDLEDWLDVAAEKLLAIVNNDNDDKNEIVKTVTRLKEEYVRRGFDNPQLHSQMERFVIVLNFHQLKPSTYFIFRTPSNKPFARAVLGTVLEKHNTVISILDAIESKHNDIHDQTIHTNRELTEELSREPIKRVDDDIENHMKANIRIRPLDASGTPFFASENKNNPVTEKLFIGSYYVGSDCSKSMRSNCCTNTKWRVQL